MSDTPERPDAVKPGPRSAGGSSDRADVHRLVGEALKRPLGSERAAYLDGACGGDRELRLEVEAKVRSEERRLANVTVLLQAVGAGEEGAVDQLMQRINDELRLMAAMRLRVERPATGRQATELVNEAFLRMFRAQRPSFENREHFFGSAARLMEQILVDWARARSRKKRGGGRERVPLDGLDVVFDRDPDEVITVSEALKELETLRERQALVVRLRYFTGLSVEETAESLGISPRTVKNDWSFARAWLHRKLRGAVESPDR